MGLWPNPSVETEGGQAVSLEVDFFHCLDRVLVIVVGGNRVVGSWFVKIGVTDVPLAFVVSLVPSGPEIVTHCRNAGWIQPVQILLDGGLRDTGSLGDAM